MVETSRTSRVLVVSPAEGTAKKLPKSKQCPKKFSSLLCAFRSCFCGCCCCASSAEGDGQQGAMSAFSRASGSCNRGLVGLMEELTSCGRPQKVPPAPDKNLPIT
ncbi:uncharacterized protein LOC108668224, partial [Hyalella azteca]|uniref:Uncharacterized protein LOC108668224 n=1 Tax=Hyalella azteca TaxID=294128 RepID=A0A8B7NBD1_HYAAZ